MPDREQLKWHVLSPDEKIERLQYAIVVLCSWLVEAQTGFNARDAAGIGRIISHGSLARAAVPEGETP